MDKETRKSIFEMKSLGISNQAIASILGLKKDTILEFCKKYHLVGPTEVILLNIMELKSKSVICPQCYSPIRQKKHGRKKRFCSDACRRAWWKEHAEAKNRKNGAWYSKMCPTCGKVFKVYGNVHQKYCSRACYINHRYRREQDGI